VGRLGPLLLGFALQSREIGCVFTISSAETNGLCLEYFPF
jgi:hypothetical protein